MNKSELIKSFSAIQDISVEEATATINSFFDAIKTALVDDDRVEIRGFGSFVVREYKGYTGRNPKNGDTVTVAPKRLPFFRAGKELKDYINKK